MTRYRITVTGDNYAATEVLDGVVALNEYLDAHAKDWPDRRQVTITAVTEIEMEATK